MAAIRRFDIAYTETAIQDIEEKAAYISQQLRDASAAETWYFRLRRTIQEDLSHLSIQIPTV